MKKLLILSLGIVLTSALYAQKGKEKAGSNPKKEARDVILGTESKNEKARPEKSASKKSEEAIWDGTSEKGGPKPSKNQPAKVRAAFQRDYPNATHVRWSKYRGDWTASFGNGITSSTAVYHANGQRKDTRTVVPKADVPKVILEDILKKRPRSLFGDIVKIEVPQLAKDIFRIKTIESGSPRFTFYDARGSEVKYDY